MDKINWEDIYVQLYAYSDQLLKAKSWFRKGKTDSYLKGKQVHDYIADAIEKYLTAPGKYNSLSGRSLVNYLKQHIIRSLIGNDAKSLENKTSSNILSNENSDEGEPFSNIENLLPFTEAFFDQEIDFKEVLNSIRNGIENDKIVEKIFEGVCCNGLKRRDVIKENQMEESEFDNGMKRLKTILKKTAKKHELSQVL